MGAIGGVNRQRLTGGVLWKTPLPPPPSLSAGKILDLRPPRRFFTPNQQVPAPSYHDVVLI
jgi:hypothetical protein